MADNRPLYDTDFQPQRQWNDKWHGSEMTHSQARAEAFYASEMQRAAFEGRLDAFDRARAQAPQTRNT